MAISSTGWKMTISLVDSAGFPTNREYFLTSANYAAAATDAAAVLAALTTITLGEVVGYTLTEIFEESAVTLPGAGIFRNNNAVLTVRLDGGGNKLATINVPMPSSGIFADTQGSNANIVDTADTGVIAFVQLFESGGKATISDGETVDELLRGKRVFKDIATTV